MEKLNAIYCRRLLKKFFLYGSLACSLFLYAEEVCPQKIFSNPLAKISFTGPQKIVNDEGGQCLEFDNALTKATFENCKDDPEQNFKLTPLHKNCESQWLVSLAIRKDLCLAYSDAGNSGGDFVLDSCSSKKLVTVEPYSQGHFLVVDVDQKKQCISVSHNGKINEKLCQFDDSTQSFAIQSITDNSLPSSSTPSSSFDSAQDFSMGASGSQKDEGDGKHSSPSKQEMEMEMEKEDQESDPSTFTKTSQTENKLPSSLSVVVYNIDRNGYGGDGKQEQGLQAITDLLKSKTITSRIDVLMLTEAWENCVISQDGTKTHGTETIAQQLGFKYYAYMTEFKEKSDPPISNPCEIGNAIISRYPMTDLHRQEFDAHCCEYDYREGKRGFMSAKIHLSPQHAVTVINTHLEAGGNAIDAVLEGINVRGSQAREMVDYAKTLSGPVIIGGDLNSPLIRSDPSLNAIRAAGFLDAHENIPVKDRKTTGDDKVLPGIGDITNLDYIFFKGIAVKESSLCTSCPWYSDHRPIVAGFDPQKSQDGSSIFRNFYYSTASLGVTAITKVGELTVKAGSWIASRLGF